MKKECSFCDLCTRQIDNKDIIYDTVCIRCGKDCCEACMGNLSYMNYPSKNNNICRRCVLKEDVLTIVYEHIENFKKLCQNRDEKIKALKQEV